MILGLMIGFFVLAIILICIGAAVEYSNDVASAVLCILAIIAMVGSIGMFVFRLFPWIYKSSEDRRYTSRCYNCC